MGNAQFGLVLASALIVSAAAAADFYVAADGDDRWSGTLPAPAGGDGPFATLGRARDAVRRRLREDAGDVTVQIRGGIYRLRETVVFGLEDSAGEATVTYEAFPGETPVFTSGRVVEGLRPHLGELPDHPREAVGRVWSAPVEGRFLTLYDGGGRLPRARSGGFVPVRGGRSEATLPPGLVRDWPNLRDVELVVRPYHAWVLNMLPLASADPARDLVRTAVPATYEMERMRFLRGEDSCWIENALEHLDEPGEWVLDTAAGRLYLWPRGDTPVVAPTLSELVRVEGDVDDAGPADRPVRGLRFRGLTFECGDRLTVSDEGAGLQHEWDFLDTPNALVRFRGTERCEILGCHFRDSGGGAVRVDLHGADNRVEGNHVERMGGGGVLLCGYGPGTKDVNARNAVVGNYIHHVGEVTWHAPAVFLWQSGGNRVAENLIHHTPYTAVIVSGVMTDFFRRGGRELGRTVRWHEITAERPDLAGRDARRRMTRTDALPFLHARDNLIERNEIHHAMQRLGDGNGVYVRGAGEGNVVRGNYIHDLLGTTIMQAAVRTDGGQTGTLIAGNVIQRCRSQGVVLKLDNRCEGNIVADILGPPRGHCLSVREGPLDGAVIRRNVFVLTSPEGAFIDELPARPKDPTEDRRGHKLARSADADTDANVYHRPADPAAAAAFLARQRADGVDANSVAADPMFVDAAAGDFRFRPGSPAHAIGIESPDLSRVGLRGRGGPESLPGGARPAVD